MQESRINTVIFIGRPGSGKGTQAKLLQGVTNWPLFSSGDEVRRLALEPTVIGTQVKVEHDHGKLSPDWLMNHLFVKMLLGAAEGFICEGFPRTVSQAKLADEAFMWLKRPYLAINLAVSEEEAMRRQLARGKEEHRIDSDEAHKVKARFAIYREQTEPVIAYFKEREKLTEINGEQSREAIAEDIRKALAIA